MSIWNSRLSILWKYLKQNLSYYMMIFTMSGKHQFNLSLRGILIQTYLLYYIQIIPRTCPFYHYKKNIWFLYMASIGEKVKGDYRIENFKLIKLLRQKGELQLFVVIIPWFGTGVLFVHLLLEAGTDGGNKARENQFPSFRKKRQKDAHFQTLQYF